jgi:uncharacterized protein (TIGR02453 family)
MFAAVWPARPSADKEDTLTWSSCQQACLRTLNRMAFTGFPAQAFTFYAQLEADNSKAFWSAHRSDYRQYVVEPIIALSAELEDEFGIASVFRPHRDIRFSADKSPYKTYQGMFVERAPGLGFYAGLSADGVLVSGGFHSHAPDQVERYRQAVDAESPGRALAELVSALAADGLAVEGDQMKTRPRGIPADHPRVELLRYRSLTASRSWPPGSQLYERDALNLVRDAWRRIVPLCDWLTEHVGGPAA